MQVCRQTLPVEWQKYQPPDEKETDGSQTLHYWNKQTPQSGSGEEVVLPPSASPSSAHKYYVPLPPYPLEKEDHRTYSATHCITQYTLYENEHQNDWTNKNEPHGLPAVPRCAPPKQKQQTDLINRSEWFHSYIHIDNDDLQDKGKTFKHTEIKNSLFLGENN